MAWLQAAMIAAPLVAQGIGAITGAIKNSKARKQIKAQTELINARNAELLKSIQAQTNQSLGAIGGGFMGPSGINTGSNGIGLMQGGPAFIQR